MSARRGAVGSMIMLAIASMASCAESTPKVETPIDPAVAAAASKHKKLDCAFLNGANNCWKNIAGSVSACLNGHVHPQGKLDAELSACTLEDDVMVKLGQSCDPDEECAVTDVFMGRAGNKCMEFHSSVTKPPSELGRGAGSFEIAAKDGTVKVEYDERSKTITCPDGTTYQGSGDFQKELASCDDETGYANMPAYAFITSASVPSVKDGKKTNKPGTVSFELATIDVLFECAKP